MTNNDTIMLRHYVPQDYSMLEAFQLSESDLKFVKTPEENITAAMSDNERYPIVVMDGRQCVAFFTLHRGKGVMEKLASFITSTFQDINEIVLTVNTDNPHAMALYRQQGYQYMGDSMFIGRPVHIMALTIK
ncbi:TPA: GNAT family N-acetyltransferase [Staphylococcus aureus]|nr:GNAT family N-acetyltransferase [Staphylococcus aureus]